MKKDVISLKEIKRYFPLEFQISDTFWKKYELDGGIFPKDGEVKLPNYGINRLLVKRIYEKKDLKAFSHEPLRAGHLNAIGLINEIFRYLLYSYKITKNPKAFDNSLKWLKEKSNTKVLTDTLDSFVESFPPIVVHFKKKDRKKYVDSKTNDLPNKHLIIKELIPLYLANNNPAFASFLELFSDKDLAEKSDYKNIFNSLDEFFKKEPKFGPSNKSLIDLMREPIKESPSSLTGQLMYMKENWHSILPEELLMRILLAIDVIKEEDKWTAMGHGPNVVPSRRDLIGEGYEEYERFTLEKDWMSKIVILAKSTYVWLDQLSKKYKKVINRLDQIPDEELDILKRWGFTGLWLIGVWERSPASQKIKQVCGNPEALASAYSLYDYTISNDLGGEGALNNLKHRAARRGIRLATDIVPNHMGIYSKWVIEHPDWFIQDNNPPFPSYYFSEPDLSHDERTGIYLENGYWTRRDAAVVFKRVDKWTGDTKYIYHGNDGTSMPWNDTAQLDFLKAEVREAVIQIILNVARNFQIIRFDAAMTLAKKHYQRLWFPQPGTGGGIPSRAERGMTKEEFDKAMPVEFWREVVDRINQEVPDTLLLAEAFWLMEGYFVRTLGMHRVYNSAFMNMLKMEDNAKYRSVVKNVLEFNPEILRRFVNFMNNPDEETAVAQFGKGDKYFGVSVMMVTMPGLPMFGHGQIEGFSEKYGMEYKRAYWNEETDCDLVRRHEAEIFPLMHKRHLFSEVENFVFYDFFRTDGYVNENVFAYSNICGNEKALIIYNNRYENTSGWVRSSTSISVPTKKAGKRKLIRKTLGEGLRLESDNKKYYVFKDHKTGLQYIRQSTEICEKGVYVELGAFQYHIFMDFKQIGDNHSGDYSRLERYLNGRGVPDIEEALKEMILIPVHTPLKSIINKDSLENLSSIKGSVMPKVIEQSMSNKLEELFKAVKKYSGSEYNAGALTKDTVKSINAVLKLKNDLKINSKSKHLNYLNGHIKSNEGLFKIPLIWSIVHNLSSFDELLLGKLISNCLSECGLSQGQSEQDAILIKNLSSYYNWFNEKTKDSLKNIRGILDDPNVQDYLNFNQHDGILWYNKEKMEKLLYWLFFVSIAVLISLNKSDAEIKDDIERQHEIIEKVLQISNDSKYKVNKLKELLIQV